MRRDAEEPEEEAADDPDVDSGLVPSFSHNIICILSIRLSYLVILRFKRNVHASVYFRIRWCVTRFSMCVTVLRLKQCVSRHGHSVLLFQSSAVLLVFPLVMPIIYLSSLEK